MTDRPSPEEALTKALDCLGRAHNVATSFTSSEHQLRQGGFNLQLAHAYMRYIELTTIKRDA